MIYINKKTQVFDGFSWVEPKERMVAKGMDTTLSITDVTIQPSEGGVRAANAYKVGKQIVLITQGNKVMIDSPTKGYSYVDEVGYHNMVSAGIAASPVRFGDEDAMNVAIQADGTIRNGKRVEMQFTKERKKVRILKLLSKLSLDYKRYNSSNQSLLGISFKPEFEIYKYFKDWKALRETGYFFGIRFLAELENWDGHCNHSNSHTMIYCSSIKSNVDVAQGICVKSGCDSSSYTDERGMNYIIINRGRGYSIMSPPIGREDVDSVGITIDSPDMGLIVRESGKVMVLKC